MISPRTGWTRRSRRIVAGLAIAAIAAGTAWTISKTQPGSDHPQPLPTQSQPLPTESQPLPTESQPLFGFGPPLDHEATGTTAAAGAGAVEAAHGLDVSLVSDKVGEDADMIALWPDSSSPAWAIICNEVDGSEGGAAASVQRVRLSDGHVEDMISGLRSCDPASRTPWGTVTVAEEAGSSGRLYEILDPLSVSGVTVDRVTGVTSDPDHVIARKALGQLSFEGVVFLPDGTVYYSDELRPSNGKPGGGIYKFVPTTPHAGGAINVLDDSPLVAGSVSVFRVGAPSDSVDDLGQGPTTGAGKWAPLTTPADPSTFKLAAAAIAAGGYTGFYRPEDMDLDPAAFDRGKRRMCWNNTGNDAEERWGETLCLTDAPTSDTTFPGGFAPVVEPFVIGNEHLRMPDNLDFQPHTGVLYILMDATTSAKDPSRTNDQVWACLPDGEDPDTLSDGCVRVLNSLDGRAEWTGIQFLADGKSFLINHMHRTQHGRAVEGTTDMLRVSGFDVKG
jgi:hypothetical protein